MLEEQKAKFAEDQNSTEEALAKLEQEKASLEEEKMRAMATKNGIPVLENMKVFSDRTSASAAYDLNVIKLQELIKVRINEK